MSAQKDIVLLKVGGSSITGEEVKLCLVVSTTQFSTVLNIASIIDIALASLY